MRIISIGDSFGCGEWTKDFSDEPPEKTLAWVWQPHINKFAKSRIIENTSAAYYLTLKGFDVENYSVGGDSNLNQLRILKNKLESGKKYDHIIWFFTEPVRDVLLDNIIDVNVNLLKTKEGYDQLVEQWFRIIFNEAEQIYQKYNISFTVIGGCERLHDSLNDYKFWQFKIDDWVNDLIYDNYVYHPHNFAQFNKLIDRYQQHVNPVWATEESDKCLRYIQIMYSHPNFPDWGHPDRHCHEQLAKWLEDKLAQINITVSRR